MAELMDIVDAFSIPLKVAWVAWLAWGIGQVYWYRRERAPQRVEVATFVPPSRRHSVVETMTPSPAVQRRATPDPIVEVPSEALSATELESLVADFEMRSRERHG